ncbi:MAG: hypothetical protein VR74_10215 [Hyphomonas sp. BRH_c22]|nr:MAG: hypothetical protein VR74_10215 [Hyphomonas sp. BRH_c22]
MVETWVVDAHSTSDQILIAQKGDIENRGRIGWDWPTTVVQHKKPNDGAWRIFAGWLPACERRQRAQKTLQIEVRPDQVWPKAAGLE